MEVTCGRLVVVTALPPLAGYVVLYTVLMMLTFLAMRLKVVHRLLRSGALVRTTKNRESVEPQVRECVTETALCMRSTEPGRLPLENLLMTPLLELFALPLPGLLFRITKFLTTWRNARLLQKFLFVSPVKPVIAMGVMLVLSLSPTVLQFLILTAVRRALSVHLFEVSAMYEEVEDDGMVDVEVVDAEVVLDVLEL